ncbi:MAG: ATP-binding cassette domain-containing protein, partial [Alphaproteobacteria bacterium]|nr:ATP-binding cassette domain-containing protein [Alphaproteobacteria bacterium]
MLEISNLRGPHLGPVDLTLDAGECVAISGPSGAGKSLLLRAIADLDPSEGSVVLDGMMRESIPAPQWRSRVGYLPAESGWWAERVGDHFLDAANATVQSLLERLSLPGKSLDWEVGRLSTGEKQRLSLVRLLERGPRVLLLDEPTSALDDETRASVEAIIGERCTDGCGVVP